MNFSFLRDLIVVTITDPARAARQIMGYDPGREALWLALGCVIVMNTFVFTLSNVLVPTDSDLIPSALYSPITYGALLAFGVVASVYAIQKSGQMLGGTGSFRQIMALVVWLQFLRVLVNVLMVVLILIAPVLSFLVVVAATIIGLYIFLHFIDQAHGFGSLMQATGVLIMSVVAMALALILIVSLLGGSSIGASSHV